MVPVASSRLTRIGFRRDIKFFLTALVGFLVVVILALVMLLQVVSAAAAERARRNWALAADAATEAIDQAAQRGRADLESQLVYLRGRYNIDSIELRPRNGSPVRSGFRPPDPSTAVLTRDASAGRITFTFDATELNSMRRRFIYTAVICLVATLFGTLMLLFYLPRITRPIEQMLDEASRLGVRETHEDEASYLIETFKSSIARLEEQESELKRLHGVEKMRADELQLITATLTRSLTSGFIAINAAGEIVDLNGAAREILRLRDDTDYSGRTIAEVFGEQSFGQHLRHALEGRRTASRQEVSWRSESETVVIGLTTVPLIGEQEQFIGVIALFADLTHVRTLEARVREMQTLADLGEISAGIAHEFRNSLSTILGYLKLARRDTLPDDTAKRVRNAEQEAAELSRAVEGLLSFARPMVPEFQEIDLAELVEAGVGKVAGAEPAVRWDVRAEPAFIHADPALLSRAIENILRNAADAILQKGTGGTVAITVTDAPVPVLSVSDDGVGLDSAEAPRLLLPFQSDKPNGLGMGLPLARKIALMHGATLRITGEKGRGATVVLSFVDNETIAQTAPVPPPPRLSVPTT
jgi:signal transduction histidine kinase